MVRDWTCSAVAGVRCRRAAAAAARHRERSTVVLESCKTAPTSLALISPPVSLSLRLTIPCSSGGITEFREQREAQQRKFDPLHGGRAPPRPSAQQRKDLEALASCASLLTGSFRYRAIRRAAQLIEAGGHGRWARRCLKRPTCQCAARRGESRTRRGARRNRPGDGRIVLVFKNGEKMLVEERVGMNGAHQAQIR